MATNPIAQAISPFIWGRGGAALTPEQVAREREVAEALMAQGIDTSPVGHWTQGAARMANVLAGKLREGRANKAETAGRSAFSDRLSGILSGSSLSGGAPMLSGSPATSAAMATAPAPDYASARVAQAHNAGAAAPIGDGWLNYANQGATRNLPLNDKLVQAMSFLPELGVTMKVVSGGQVGKGEKGGRVGSTRHDHGNAADVDFFIGDRKLTPKNEADRAILSQIVQRGKAAGVTGWGEGDDYMGSGRVHLGFGSPGVWGAGGRSANAPEWLVQAYNTPYENSAVAANEAMASGAMAAQDPMAFQQPAAPLAEPRMVNDMPVADIAQSLTRATVNPDLPMAGNTSGFLPVAQSLAAQPQQQGGMPNMQQLIELASDPWATDAQRQVVGALLQQQMQAQDPMRQAQLEKLRLETDQLRSGSPGASSSFGNLDAQARAAGLVPGTPQYQDFMLHGGGAPATFRALDMQAQAAGFAPGTPEYNEFMATRGAGLQAGAAQMAKNVADIDTGGAAAGAKIGGQKTMEAGFDAWKDYGKLQTSIGNMDEAIAALDSGAQTGIIYKMLPNITEASASLQNAMDRMGLDVIGSVTFGALSEGEMRLAMQTAAPRDLPPAELRSWLAKKRDAQIKAADMLADAAQFLTKPGNTINDWIERNRAAKKAQGTTGQASTGIQWSIED